MDAGAPFTCSDVSSSSARSTVKSRKTKRKRKMKEEKASGLPHLERLLLEMITDDSTSYIFERLSELQIAE